MARAPYKLTPTSCILRPSHPYLDSAMTTITLPPNYSLVGLGLGGVVLLNVSLNTAAFPCQKPLLHGGKSFSFLADLADEQGRQCAQSRRRSLPDHAGARSRGQSRQEEAHLQLRPASTRQHARKLALRPRAHGVSRTVQPRTGHCR